MQLSPADFEEVFHQRDLILISALYEALQRFLFLLHASVTIEPLAKSFCIHNTRYGPHGVYWTWKG